MTSTAPILAPELAKAVAAQHDRLDLDVLSRAYRISAAEPAFVSNPYAGVGRNDPCPCGSGKKFKRCHGAGA